MKTEISGKTYNLREELKNNGFRWYSDKKVWVKEHNTIEEYYDIKEKFGQISGVKIRLLDSCYSRDNLYRAAFFDRYHGFFGIYRCAYCGTPMRKKNVTVDHIVPISQAADSKLSKFFLKYIGAKNINSVKNLTPCCRRCNSSKGSSRSLRLFFKGYSGKTSLGITIRRLCTLISLLSLIGILIEIFYLIAR